MTDNAARVRTVNEGRAIRVLLAVPLGGWTHFAGAGAGKDELHSLGLALRDLSHDVLRYCGVGDVDASSGLSADPVPVTVKGT